MDDVAADSILLVGRMANVDWIDGLRSGLPADVLCAFAAASFLANALLAAGGSGGILCMAPIGFMDAVLVAIGPGDRGSHLPDRRHGSGNPGAGNGFARLGPCRCIYGRAGTRIGCRHKGRGSRAAGRWSSITLEQRGRSQAYTTH